MMNQLQKMWHQIWMEQLLTMKEKTIAVIVQSLMMMTI
jgi:hypothetical protein